MQRLLVDALIGNPLKWAAVQEAVHAERVELLKNEQQKAP